MTAAVPQPQPSWPAALASASLTQPASRPAGGGPPQQPAAATSPARLPATTSWRVCADGATAEPTGVSAIRLVPLTGAASVGPQHNDAVSPPAATGPEQTPVS